MEVFQAYYDSFCQRNLEGCLKQLDPNCEALCYKKDDHTVDVAPPAYGIEAMKPGYVHDFASAEEPMVRIENSPVETVRDVILRQNGRVVKDARVVKVLFYTNIYKVFIEVNYAIDPATNLMVQHECFL